MTLTEPELSAIHARATALLSSLGDTSGQWPSRDEALALTFEHTQSPALRSHMLAVEAAMAAYADEHAADANAYRVVGLLHDFDYEQHPDPREHPLVGCELLAKRSYNKELIEAILGHATYTGIERRSLLARTLFAVDELTGFLTAVAYVRPEGLGGMTWKSFNKKFKTPSFAAGVDRDEVAQGARELGVDLREHVLFLSAALRDAFPSFPSTVTG